MIDRHRVRDVFFALLGILALLLKHRVVQFGGVLVHNYGGNVAASFAAFFVLKLPAVPGRFRLGAAAVLTLLAAELFEANNGLGFMSNTYDPGDYLANAVGVALALGVEVILMLASRLRRPATTPDAWTRR
jgi:hypothetical protein